MNPCFNFRNYLATDNNMADSFDDGDDSMADFFNEIDAMPTPVSERKTLSDAAAEIEITLSPETAALDLPELTSEPLIPAPPAASKPRRTSTPEPQPEAPRPKPRPRPKSTPKTRPKPTPTKRILTTPGSMTVRSTAASRARERQISPPKSTGRSTTPSRRNYGPLPTGHDGLTMWERSKLHMEQRERKLQALQEKFYEEYTFSPNTASTSSYKKNSSTTASSLSSKSSEKKMKSSGIVGDNISVFERLYARDEAKRASTPTRTPPRAGSRGRSRAYDTPGSKSTLSLRVEALYSLGRQKVEAKKNLSEKVRLRAFFCIFSQVVRTKD